MNRKKYIQKQQQRELCTKRQSLKTTQELNPQGREKQTKALQTMLTAGPLLGLDFETKKKKKTM